MQRNGTNEPGGVELGGGVSVEFPFTKHVSPRHDWSREVCEPMAHPPNPPIYPTHPSTHPPTHPPIPPNHPSINPLTHYPFPNPPLGPNNPSGSTPPPTPPTDLPTHPSTHSLLCPNNCTNPKHIYLSCQMSSHIIAHHPFRIQN